MTEEPQDHQFILLKPLSPEQEEHARTIMRRFQDLGYTVIPEATEETLTISAYAKRTPQSKEAA